jgi:hypothetical protein
MTECFLYDDTCISFLCILILLNDYVHVTVRRLRNKIGCFLKQLCFVYQVEQGFSMGVTQLGDRLGLEKPC